MTPQERDAKLRAYYARELRDEDHIFQQIKDIDDRIEFCEARLCEAQGFYLLPKHKLN